MRRRRQMFAMKAMRTISTVFPPPHLFCCTIIQRRQVFAIETVHIIFVFFFVWFTFKWSFVWLGLGFFEGPVFGSFFICVQFFPNN